MIFVLVDGLGLGLDDPAVNPIHGGACPTLERLLHEAHPLDASMGVAGIPQSATGQTALLTGVNAAHAVGRHVEGFPGPSLRTIIRRHNILRRIRLMGLRCTFANAYFVDRSSEAATRIPQSVTTVSALSALGRVRTRHDLDRDNAVYQDITRASLAARGYTGPLVTPETAAEHLARISGRHAFTLFEYFQTDRMGHKGSPAEAAAVLSVLDRFVAATLARLQTRGRWLFLMTSDHGNIEDARVRHHTMNAVPLVAVGPSASEFAVGLTRIEQVAPAILRFLRKEHGGRLISAKRRQPVNRSRSENGSARSSRESAECPSA